MMDYLPNIDDANEELKRLKTSCEFNTHDFHSEPAIYLFLLKHECDIAQRFVEQMNQLN